ncbi:hypothetical protein [Halolamina sp.]|jgi:hypothetical protein|uniref:DUF7266 family protein n=1 Tax=Halolamina sp. TaxID=1940283 RepID=UPI000223BCDB|nr:hypothetical protein Halar_3136 [halophilic archaeon DL31]
MNGAFAPDSRALTPAVGKALEVGIVVMFVGVMTTALYGGVVPDYRNAVGDEVADRTTVAAAERVENAVPPPARNARVVHRVDLPASIRGSGYRIAVTGRTLVLEHPSPEIEARTRLALPARVDDVSGGWESGEDAVVVVTGDEDELSVRLTDRRTVEGDG